MLKIFPALAFAGILASCNNESNTTTSTDKDTANNTAMNTTNTLTDQEKNEGWQLLFDGQSSKGWHKYGGDPVGAAWKVSDGMLWLDSSTKKDWQLLYGGDIATDEEYDNFHLKLDWKIDSGGNSGIMFLVHEDSVKYKYPWMTGPEMQVLDNERHADAKIPKHRAGDLYDIIACSKETVKPALEWNSVEIKVLNGRLDFWLNGENVVSTTLWDESWKQLIKNTKWANHADFSTYKKGKIALQDHGNVVWFRNIKIKKL